MTRSAGCSVSQKKRSRKDFSESSPFSRLQARQAGNRLSSSLVPPRDLATTWSRVMLLTLRVQPQYAQWPAVLFRIECFFVISATIKGFITCSPSSDRPRKQGRPVVRHWLHKEGLCSIAHSYDFDFVTLSIGDSSEGGHSQRWGFGFRHVMNQFEVYLPSILAVSSTARMSIVNGTRAGTTGKGGECTVFAAHFFSVTDGNDLRSIDGINPSFTDFSFRSIICNHDFDELKFFKKIFFQKALKPKQKVAIDAPTRISSKFVRCSISLILLRYHVECIIMPMRYSPAASGNSS